MICEECLTIVRRKWNLVETIRKGQPALLAPGKGFGRKVIVHFLKNGKKVTERQRKARREDNGQPHH